MATQLAIVNNILRRLRETEVTSVADHSYSKLIAQFVNDAKDDIEDINHEWSVYVQEIDTTILADGTRTYDITETNDRSWLMRDYHDDRVPAAYDITTGEVSVLCDIPNKDLKRIRATTNNITDDEDYPRVFALKADADGRGWTIELLWGADNARSWRSYWYIPQAELALDGSDDATNILLPRRPVEMRAMYYALNERGEEMGQPGGLAWERSTSAIAAALEVDLQVQKKSDEIDIKRNESL
jgi:hypothetical protein